MRVLFLTFALSLSALLQAQDALSMALKNDKTGTWYIKAMVVNKELPKEKRPTSMAPVIVTALDGGELEATHTFMKKGQCHEMKIVLQPTDDPGKYTAHGGKKNVQIEEMLTEDHYMLFIQGQCHGNPFRMVKLLGRTPDLNLNALEEFKTFIKSKDLPEESIFLPTQMEKCTPESEIL